MASLNEQVKASNYWQQTAASSTQTAAAAATSGQKNDSASSALTASPSSDVDTYSSFHSEIGPHKSRTTTSQLVSGDSGQPRGVHGPAIIRSSQVVYPTADKSLLVLNNLLESAYPVGDLLRNNNNSSKKPSAVRHQQREDAAAANSRVRRDDSEERENEDSDDADGVWVDDDDEDDNRQQSSDVNETAQDPGESDDRVDAHQPEDSNQHRSTAQMNPPNGALHGYEISPDDLMVYPPAAGL